MNHKKLTNYFRRCYDIEMSLWSKTASTVLYAFNVNFEIVKYILSTIFVYRKHSIPGFT